ncbi:methyl-accepting chemotaxis protein [Alkaliphilus metalliredigens]|uniref:methyl-accepting chemotaxis protein n=1 Tax=Alkaliphilus metalliredigens TaxID=208226 RepID=UPI00005CB0FE|nr:methyl-accepting chemotaxis protein [Alkaliphilus metalliredigens]
MKSIKTKLIVYFSVLILFVSGSFAIVSLTTAGDAVTQEVDKALGLLAEEGSRMINARIDTHYVYIEGLSTRDLISSEEASLEEKLTFLEVIVQQREDYIRIGIVGQDGFLHFTDSFRTDDTGIDVNMRDYFTDSMAGRRGMMPPTVSINPADNGSVVVALSAPIYNTNNEVIGGLVGIKDANFLNAISDDMGFGDMGYAFMINGEGTVIAYPDRDRVINQWNPIEEVQHAPTLQSMAGLFETMIEEQTGVSSYQFEGNDLYSGYAPIEGTDWIMAITANEEEVLGAIPRLQRSITLTAVIILAISIALCYLIGNSIVKPIISTIRYSERIADLDITEDMPEVLMKRKDEIGSLATAFQTITDNLRVFIRQISDTSQQVAASSEELTASSQQSATAADEVARTIEEIAKGANDQAKDTEKGVEHINELGDLIEKDQQFIRNLNTSANEVIKLKDDGLEILKELVKKSNTTNQSAKKVHEIIVNTNESAEKIDSASQMIKDIAAQTNLLALNAAIEAARCNW